MDYLPDPEAKWGHDPHFITACPAQPDHLWQQNHCGVFYSEDGAQTWTKMSIPDAGVHFGFPVAVDAHDGCTAWVVPARADTERMAINGGLFVARTTDGGQTWQSFRNGPDVWGVHLQHVRYRPEAWYGRSGGLSLFW